MAITKRPHARETQPATAAAFINGAPDAPAASEKLAAGRKRENKKQIAITIAPELLATIDALAGRRGMSRAATISLACSELVERSARD